MTQVLDEAARIANWGQPCQLPGGAGVVIDGKTYDVNPAFVEGWQAWEILRIAYDYLMPGTDTGHYSCRHILHNDALPWSEHAWRGLAFDMNWLQNPWTTGDEVITDMPTGMTDAIQQIRTMSGEFVFRWGGDWDRDPTTDHSTYDAMHFSQTASKVDLATGIDWSTVEGEDLGQLNDHQLHMLTELVRGWDKFNADNPLDQTTGYGVGRLGSKTIRQHEREEGTGWDHPAVEGFEGPPGEDGKTPTNLLIVNAEAIVTEYEE